MRLLRQADVLYRGHHIGMGSYFSSLKLLFELYNAGTLATGTVGDRKKVLPRQCVTSQLRDQQVCERRKGPRVSCVFLIKTSRGNLLFFLHWQRQAM